MEFGRFHVIIDIGPDGPDAVALARRVIGGGAPTIQVRPKRLTDRAAYDLVAAIAKLCRASSVQCIVNDRPDLALAVGADGCHVGEHDLPVAAVRMVLGERGVVGGTARNPTAAAQHRRDGATYLGVGPVYATTSKTGLPDPIGIDMLGAVAGAVDIPVIAISGITVERVPELMAAGAYGVAVIGAVANADDPESMTARFVETITRSLESR